MEATCVEEVDFLSHKADEVILHDTVEMICGQFCVQCDRTLKIDSWNPDVIQLRIEAKQISSYGANVFGTWTDKLGLQGFSQWDLADTVCPKWAIDEYFLSKKEDKFKAAKTINEAHIKKLDRETCVILRQFYTELFGAMGASCDNYFGARLIYWPRSQGVKK